MIPINNRFSSLLDAVMYFRRIQSRTASKIKKKSLGKMNHQSILKANQIKIQMSYSSFHPIPIIHRRVDNNANR